MTAIEHRVHTAAQVRQLDQVAIQEYGIPAYTLMSQAGQAVFGHIRAAWPDARSLCVLCGGGNNGGDGYVIARLALQAGWRVTLLALGDVLRLQDASRQAFGDFMAAGGQALPFDGQLPEAEVMVDALLGTGLDRAVEGAYAAAINLLNQQAAPVVAVDIPSGLHTDTGQPCGCAVEADLTVTFIGLKAGLLTGRARDHCGELHFARLEVPDEVYARVPADMQVLGSHTLAGWLPPRRRSTHKGDCGHALLVGGAPGMSGAVRLAGEAALRAGSGLASVATHPEHAPVLNLLRPELMVNAIESPVHLRPLLQRIDAIGIGPGMGQTAWSRGLLTIVQTAEQPKVLDADALNLLAQTRSHRDDWILTPHPGEAARLLACETAAIEQDRVAAARRLQHEYGGVVVLKGAGALVASAEGVAFCPAGNPGMASGGMGDALTGVITGLLAQGLALRAAAEVGVWAHARAGDLAAMGGERGLLASDLLAHLREAINL
ncbi:NAD(P)H-hydrate dehydratase [Candidatus Thiothrix sp. Deng01]|uniref:Bifunctional NAD(P)H-hydrate repair enzyme n=1 Tax=Candidatus Thiothrix phosphatis TaxID=3112415 RepID=A0ABU6D0Z4_9GAMM|nr:NAD(P)H-hydrate dehydratase [Candidatus Thiothrix sp. Deng01]MEB4592008.1 NAD(P)H-hydrate dehydratase [Candidatus Thiothrix sp. Deng01]